MGRGVSCWDESRIAKMLELKESGLSAGLIAMQLETTRNAILGKLHRLGVRIAGRTSRRNSPEYAQERSKLAAQRNRTRRLSNKKWDEKWEMLLKAGIRHDEERHHDKCMMAGEPRAPMVRRHLAGIQPPTTKPITLQFVRCLEGSGRVMDNAIVARFLAQEDGNELG